MGGIATIGARLVLAAAFTFSSWRVPDAVALFAMLHNRATASMHGKHRRSLGPGSSELHNSHFITTFLLRRKNVSRPAVLGNEQLSCQIDCRRKWLSYKTWDERCGRQWLIEQIAGS
jgi:hypothetical protein